MEKTEWNVKKPWAIGEPLIGDKLKDREILFMTLEAAGFLVYHESRNYVNVEKFPYIAHIRGHITASRGIGKYEQVLPYEWVLEELRKIIKNEHQEEPVGNK